MLGAQRVKCCPNQCFFEGLGALGPTHRGHQGFAEMRALGMHSRWPLWKGTKSVLPGGYCGNYLNTSTMTPNSSTPSPPDTQSSSPSVLQPTSPPVLQIFLQIPSSLVHQTSTHPITQSPKGGRRQRRMPLDLAWRANRKASSISQHTLRKAGSNLEHSPASFRQAHANAHECYPRAPIPDPPHPRHPYPAVLTLLLPCYHPAPPACS